MEIWKIYIIDFPFTDWEGIKQRPVLIINKQQEDFEVLFITNVKQNNILKLSKTDFSEKWLNLESYVRLNKWLLFSKNLLANWIYVWKLKSSTMKEIYKQIVLNYSKINFDSSTFKCIENCINK
jgi:hypothetical protein